MSLAGALCPIHRVVGPLEERDRIVARSQLGDAGREIQLSRTAERARGDRVTDPPVEPFGVVDRRFREDDGELVAADTTRDVGRTNDAANAVRRLCEHGVAGEVPDLVVDPLEIIEVVRASFRS